MSAVGHNGTHHESSLPQLMQLRRGCSPPSVTFLAHPIIVQPGYLDIAEMQDAWSYHS